MNDVKLTNGQATCLWWAIFWRSTLVSVALGLFLGYLFNAFGVQYPLLAMLTSLAITIPIGILIVKHVIEKKLTRFGYRLVAVSE